MIDVSYGEIFRLSRTLELEEFITWLTMEQLEDLYQEAYSKEHLRIAVAIQEEMQRQRSLYG